MSVVPVVPTALNTPASAMHLGNAVVDPIGTDDVQLSTVGFPTDAAVIGCPVIAGELLKLFQEPVARPVRGMHSRLVLVGPVERSVPILHSLAPSDAHLLLVVPSHLQIVALMLVAHTAAPPTDQSEIGYWPRMAFVNVKFAAVACDGRRLE